MSERYFRIKLLQPAVASEFDGIIAANTVSSFDISSGDCKVSLNDFLLLTVDIYKRSWTSKSTVLVGIAEFDFVIAECAVSLEKRQ